MSKGRVLPSDCRSPIREATMITDGSPRILIIDDELSICQNCIKILSKIDCEVEYALNGYDALKMMEAEPFEVIITDLKMSRRCPPSSG